MSDKDVDPEIELGAPGGDDSVVGVDSKGDNAESQDLETRDSETQDSETGEYGPGVDIDTGANVGDTGKPAISNNP